MFKLNAESFLSDNVSPPSSPSNTEIPDTCTVAPLDVWSTDNNRTSTLSPNASGKYMVTARLSCANGSAKSKLIFFTYHKILFNLS